MKFEDDRHRSNKLHMSSGDSFVLELRLESATSLDLMTSMQSLIGTDGNKASASNDIIWSSGPRVRVLTWETNWVEFLQVKGLLSM